LQQATSRMRGCMLLSCPAPMHGKAAVTHHKELDVDFSSLAHRACKFIALAGQAITHAMRQPSRLASSCANNHVVAFEKLKLTAFLPPLQAHPPSTRAMPHVLMRWQTSQATPML
jgi:anthranilate/para-aminobenzoate synthase component II